MIIIVKKIFIVFYKFESNFKLNFKFFISSKTNAIFESLFDHSGTMSFINSLISFSFDNFTYTIYHSIKLRFGL